MNVLYPPGAQFLQTVNLSLDIVGLDIQMYAAGVTHYLHLNIETVLRIVEPLVLRGLGRW